MGKTNPIYVGAHWACYLRGPNLNELGWLKTDYKFLLNLENKHLFFISLVCV